MIIFVQRDLSFGGLSLVVSLMSWTIKISPKLKEVEVGHGHGERGSNIEEERWIKILGPEKHTNRGSKLTNFA